MTVRPETRRAIQEAQASILAAWMQAQREVGFRTDLSSERITREESARFLADFNAGLAVGTDLDDPAWAAAREMLTTLSASRAQQGFTPSESATFVFSLKEPLFSLLLDRGGDPASLKADLWGLTKLLDRLGLVVVEAFLSARETIIRRQQEDLIELSTPVVKLWDRILALPIIGTLDSARTQSVMQSLLQQIVETGAEIAIIDITGVPTVDTLVAQHLLKTAAAARLMGADCIISGIRPQIAQTIVHLGVELGDISTKATMADAFMLALRRLSKSSGTSMALPSALLRAPGRDA